ncbi:MAG: hypothetical protein U0792_12445 [Gemmataceae bacterium]
MATAVPEASAVGAAGLNGGVGDSEVVLVTTTMGVAARAWAGLCSTWVMVTISNNTLTGNVARGDYSYSAGMARVRRGVFNLNGTLNIRNSTSA